MENINILLNLIEERDFLRKSLMEMKANILVLRKGTIFVKNDCYFYLKYYENGKTISLYLGSNLSDEEINKIKQETRNYKILKKRIKETELTIAQLNKQIKFYGGSKYGY